MTIITVIFLSLIVMGIVFHMVKDKKKESKIKTGLIISEIMFMGVFLAGWKIKNEYWYLNIVIMFLIQTVIELLFLKKIINNDKKRKIFWNINLIYKILLIAIVVVQQEPLFMYYFIKILNFDIGINDILSNLFFYIGVPLLTLRPLLIYKTMYVENNYCFNIINILLEIFVIVVIIWTGKPNEVIFLLIYIFLCLYIPITLIINVINIIKYNGDN